MTFLPIVARELRAAARRRGTYHVRSGAALGMILIGAWFLLMKQNQPAQVIAMGLFVTLTAGSVVYCLLRGVWSTADCLSAEKREGTLGLLFLTDLRGYDVVLGKLVATSVGGLYGVLAVVPIMALPVLLGGVTGGEFARMALVVLNTLLFSLALGMCVSAVSRSSRRAMALTFWLIFSVTVVLPACGLCQAVMTGTLSVGKGWLLASTGYSYYRALDLSYSRAAEEFWRSVAVIHGIAWMSLLLASVLVSRVWQSRPAGPRTLRWRERWRAWTRGSQAYRGRFRRQLLNRNAYFWLAARVRWRQAHVWTALALVAGGWSWGLVKWGRDWLDESVYLTTGLLLNAVIKVAFAGEAGRQLGEDRTEGSLELLLSTPLTVKEILHGQLQALRRHFQGPVTVVLLVLLLFMILGAFDARSQSEIMPPASWVLLCAASMVLLAVDLAGLYWLGMWRGLTSKSAPRAGAETVGSILLLPWAVTILGMMLASLLWPTAADEQIQWTFLGLWFGSGLAVDLGFGLWARHKLLTGFRVAAARRYEQRPGFWRRLFTGP